MIVYGYRTTIIKVEPLPYEKCPACEHEGAMKMHILSSHAHLFWIPFFPYRKFGIAHCENCNHSYEKKDMTESMQRELATIKSEARQPIWSFSGLILIGILIVAFKVSDTNHESNNQKYIKSPAVGDMYSIKLEGGYSLMKIIAIDDSIVEILANEYMTDKISGLSDLKYGKPFTDTLVTTKSSIQEMFAEGTIFDVERK